MRLRHVSLPALANRPGTLNNYDQLWQPKAARHAAAFAFEILAKFADSIKGEPRSREIAGPVEPLIEQLQNALATAISSLGLGQGAESGLSSKPIPQPSPAAIVRVVERLLSAWTGSNLAIAASTSVEPPPLPTPHISRAETFSNLARELDAHTVVAVIGYPKSGKTTALAEFARQYPGTPLWLTGPSSTSSSQEWSRAPFFNLPHTSASIYLSQGGFSGH